jgi:hypothetical protein
VVAVAVAGVAGVGKKVPAGKIFLLAKVKKEGYGK